MSIDYKRRSQDSRGLDQNTSQLPTDIDPIGNTVLVYLPAREEHYKWINELK